MGIDTGLASWRVKYNLWPCKYLSATFGRLICRIYRRLEASKKIREFYSLSRNNKTKIVRQWASVEKCASRRSVLVFYQFCFESNSKVRREFICYQRKFHEPELRVGNREEEQEQTFESMWLPTWEFTFCSSKDCRISAGQGSEQEQSFLEPKNIRAERLAGSADDGLKTQFIEWFKH